MDKDQVYGCLFGLCVGEALGVPVEGRTRESLSADPVTDMIGNGAFHQPPGTWSDISALAFCVVESICGGFSLSDLAARVVRVIREGYWTANGALFDIGATTRKALARLEKTLDRPENAGPRGENENGNGALAFVLPLAFSTLGLSFEERFKTAAQVTSLTHGHMRAITGSMILLELTRELLGGHPPHEALTRARKSVRAELSAEPELSHYARILDGDIAKLRAGEIRSGGYTVETLEAAIWCLVTERNYAGTVLKAVNLGGDTHVVTAIAGALAGLADGFKGIPKRWRDHVTRKEDITDLASRFYSIASSK